MRNPALLNVPKKLLKETAQLTAGERFCIVTDTKKLWLAELISEVAYTMQTDPVLVVMVPRAQHGEEVGELVASCMEGADLVFQVVTHAMTHTDATQSALRNGARIVVMRGITQDLMLRGAVNADYAAIAVRSALVAKRLEGAKEVQVRTPQGTDLVMSVEGRHPHVLDGILKGPGSFAAMTDGVSRWEFVG